MQTTTASKPETSPELDSISPPSKRKKYCPILDTDPGPLRYLAGNAFLDGLLTQRTSVSEIQQFVIKGYQKFSSDYRKNHGKQFLICIAELLQNDISWHFHSQGDLVKFLPTYCDDLQQYTIENLMNEICERICLTLEARSYSYTWSKENHSFGWAEAKEEISKRRSLFEDD